MVKNQSKQSNYQDFLTNVNFINKLTVKRLFTSLNWRGLNGNRIATDSIIKSHHPREKM